jgi:uncharacterized membrane protein YhaH (DUF805 family)
MNWYTTVLKKYAVFTGRARRKEFWMFVLFNVIISFVLGIVDGVAGLNKNGFGVLGAIYTLAVLIPGIAVSIRRLHDTDRSGWMLLLGLIPLVGAIILLVFYIGEGTPGTNRFGPDPKREPAYA